MKLRLPKVPPGDRLRLKYSEVTPYACSSAVPAPSAPARPRAQSTGRARPSRRKTRPIQNSAAPESEIASARVDNQ